LFVPDRLPDLKSSPYKHSAVRHFSEVGAAASGCHQKGFKHYWVRIYINRKKDVVTHA